MRVKCACPSLLLRRTITLFLMDEVHRHLNDPLGQRYTVYFVLPGLHVRQNSKLDI